MTFQWRHVSAATVLHLLLFALLAGGVQCSRTVPPTRVIEAVLYDASRQEVREQKRTDEQRRKLEEQKRADEQKRLEEQRRKEQEKKREADQKRQAQEKAEAERQRKATELKEKQEQERRKRAADDQHKKELQKKEQQEKREREEQEKRAAAQKAEMQREIEQENLRREMERESAALSQAELNAQVNAWAARVTAHIEKNWIRPSDLVNDFSCQLQVKLLPDGTVTSVRITRSCGTPSLNKSVEDAVYRSSPVPAPENPAAFDRDLTINFTPELE